MPENNVFRLEDPRDHEGPVRGPEDAPSSASKIISYIKDNPGKATMHLISILSILAPGLISGPLLWILGFGGLGPRAASFASLVQTAATPARGLFATLQSAAMGGYGTAVVNAITQLGGVAGMLGSLLKDLMRKVFSGEGENENKEEKKLDNEEDG